MTCSTTARAAFGIHSIDHFALDVPSLAEATRFLSEFGFELETEGLQLLLRTPAGHHLWAKVRQGARKRLAYLSLNCFADDFAPLRAQIMQAGGREAAPAAQAVAEGFRFEDPDGNLLQLRPGIKTSPDFKPAARHEAASPRLRGAGFRAETPGARPMRLSHVLMFTPDIRAAIAFYEQALGMKLSDGSEGIVAFLHGRHGSDHHLIAFAQGAAKGWHHSAWDVPSVDEVGIGKMQMQRAGYAQGWGGDMSSAPTISSTCAIRGARTGSTRLTSISYPRAVSGPAAIIRRRIRCISGGRTCLITSSKIPNRKAHGPETPLEDIDTRSNPIVDEQVYQGGCSCGVKIHNIDIINFSRGHIVPRTKSAMTGCEEIKALPLEAPDQDGRTWASILEQTVRQDIIAGKLPAGSKLRLKELAERYQAGVIPLREALSRLCTTGFVLAIDQRGFWVTDLFPEELLDITRVKQQIETSALRDAIEAGDVGWESEVIAAHHRLTRIPMLLGGRASALNPDWEDAHAAFHRTVVDGCRSPWTCRLSAMLRDQTARYRFLSIAMPKTERTRDVAAEHEAIVNAIVNRNANEACRLLSDHFQATMDLLLTYLQQQKVKSKPARKSAVTKGLVW